MWGEHVGEIRDIVLYMPTGQVAYAVLSFGGSFMGWNNKLFAVPWEALGRAGEKTEHEGPQDRRFVLNVNKKELEEAPGFDKENWPDPEDLGWLVPVYEFYSCTPFWC
ncbi:MAG: PRC-barrel domain-containing protein [Chloroflexota bacterium]